jgi:DNA-binding response OmpR family regulator
MSNEYILIVDDDKDIRNLIGIYLENEGYNIIKCDQAESAIEVLKNHKIDLILLDVMMPGMNGIEACMKIREMVKMPIIFISAKVEELDVVQGLLAGGDDYITKPFSPIQLITRVKAQIRRYKQYNEGNAPINVLQYEDLTVDVETRRVWVNGREIDLTMKEYGILELLLRNKGNVLSTAQIYERIWHEDFFEAENTVMTHIANLRSKLRSANDNESYIKTVWGRGYKI